MLLSPPWRTILALESLLPITTTGRIVSKALLGQSRSLSSYHLPFRRNQRFRCKRSLSPSFRQDLLFFNRRYTPSLVIQWPNPSPDKGKTSTTSSAAAGKQKESEEQASQHRQAISSETDTASIRVTDKRSASETVRQADLSAREADKEQVAQKIHKVGDERQQQQQQQQQPQMRKRTATTAEREGDGVEEGRSQGLHQNAEVKQNAASSAGTPEQREPREIVSGTIKSKRQVVPQVPVPSSFPSPKPARSSPVPSASPTTTSMPAPSTSELLKQRLQQAQERLERPMPTYGLGLSGAGPSINFDSEGHIIHQAASGTSSAPLPSSTAAGSEYTSNNSAGSTGGSATLRQGADHSGDASHSAGATGEGGMVPASPVPSMDTTEFRAPMASLDHLFDTRLFVKRLEEAGFLNAERLREAMKGGDVREESEERQQQVRKWIESARSSSKSTGEQIEGVTAASESTPTMELSTSPPYRPHDPAEAVMQLTSAAITTRATHTLNILLNRVQVENHRYLFTAALSELRTELHVRARNDAAALRSLTTLLRRKVDGLSQRMREDIERMKHDIQIDMNNRKGEAKEEKNFLDQEIQDLNNRLTISLSDLKTDIEQSIKWDLTRRALALVFGLASILVLTLLAADFVMRRAERIKAEEVAAAMAESGDTYQGYPAAIPAASPPSSSGGLISRRNKLAKSFAAHPTPQSTGSSNRGGMAGQAPASTQQPLSLRPAEELGLVEQYEQEEQRFV